MFHILFCIGLVQNILHTRKELPLDLVQVSWGLLRRFPRKKKKKEGVEFLSPTPAGAVRAGEGRAAPLAPATRDRSNSFDTVIDSRAAIVAACTP